MSEIGNNEQQKRAEKVVTGDVKIKKKSEVSKLSDIFIAEDVGNVGLYIWRDVLVPAIKKAVSDVVRDGIDMLLYGSASNKKPSSGATYVSYNKMSYNNRDDRSIGYNENRTRSGYSYDDLVFPSRGEAEEVRTRMDELIETYGVVRVADMYDLAGISCDYTHNKYGWTNIRNAEIVRVRDGYMLKMPKALPVSSN